MLDGIDRRAEAVDGDDAETFRRRMSALDECVSVLPDEYRVPIHLCYRLDAPMASIAREIGASVEATKKRMQRARAMIAACMESKGAAA